MRTFTFLGLTALATACAFAQQQAAPPAPPAPPQVFPWSAPAGGSYLGVHASDIDGDRMRELKLKEERGVEIMSVEADSPAEKAGLQKGDVVLEYNGQRVEGTEQFVRMVRETPPGRTARLGVSRNGTMQTLTATIGRRKAKAPAQLSEQISRLREMPQVWIPDIPRAFTSWKSSMLGIEAESLSGQLAQYFGVTSGVLVRSVAEGSAAAKAGLKAGDVIVKVAGENTDSPRDISSAIRSQRPQRTFPLTAVRERKEISLSVTLDDEQGRVTRREDRDE
jgi:S1-C subfamily serine protease